MIFHWSLSDSKSPEVSRSFFNILADLNNVVVWVASTRPLLSSSSSPLTKPLWTVPSALITTGINVTFMFHNCFSSLVRLKYLSLFLFYLIFTVQSVEKAKSTIRHVHFFITKSGRPARIW